MPAVCVRRAGENNVLVEFGAPTLDLVLRFQVQALLEELSRAPAARHHRSHARHPFAADSFRCGARRAGAILDWLEAALARLPSVDRMRLPSRIVHLPLSWDDPATQLATLRYQQSVRADAPWCPDNIEFIRRINGLDSREAVREIVFDASYLVMGLGDVYLGAPVATPLDPRHRLVTTKYNPARTWTPENAVGIGGAYLCVYGMEGPGGYQFVGRTVQMWNRYKQTADFRDGKQWLLRFFDQIRFYPVSAEELLELRAGFPHGRHALRIEESSLELGEYLAFLERERDSIEAFRRRQREAFAAERERWRVAGLSETPAVEATAEARNRRFAGELHRRDVARVRQRLADQGRSRPDRRQGRRARDHGGDENGNCGRCRNRRYSGFDSRCGGTGRACRRPAARAATGCNHDAGP